MKNPHLQKVKSVQIAPPHMPSARMYVLYTRENIDIFVWSFKSHKLIINQL